MGACAGPRLRVAARPVEIDLAALPATSLMPEPSREESLRRGGAPHGGGLVQRGGRVTVAGHAFGRMTLGASSASFAALGDGGLYPAWSHGASDYWWESFDPQDGDLLVESGVGLYDVDTSLISETWHGASARAARIADGLAYAYRTTRAACAAGERERLHVVIAGAAFGDLAGEAHVVGDALQVALHLTLPLEPETSGAARASVGRASARAWAELAHTPLEQATAFLLRVEASRGAEGTRAVALLTREPM